MEDKEDGGREEGFIFEKYFWSKPTYDYIRSYLYQLYTVGWMTMLSIFKRNKRRFLEEKKRSVSKESKESGKMCMQGKLQFSFKCYFWCVIWMFVVNIMNKCFLTGSSPLNEI